MRMTLRKLARQYDDCFAFVMAFQAVQHRDGRGCSGARELARVWHRVH